MKKTTTTTTKTEIKSAAIYRCTCKSTHEVFYMVASDSEAGVFYQVRFNTSAARWECQCPSAYPCKHVRAVNEVLAIRRARIATQMGGSVPAIVAQMQAEEDKRIASVQVESRAATFADLKTQFDIRQQVAAVADAEQIAHNELVRQGAVAETLAQIEEDRRVRHNATLNGNRPFSFMR
jgi:SWIM zinc finger